MPAAQNAPIKIDVAVDRLATDAAHFLGRSKKEFVADAIREYVEAHREDIDAGIKAAMSRLDGSNAAAVALLTGFTQEQLGELGGVPEDK